jgi:DNA-binding XRE family transcriptional regulator
MFVILTVCNFDIVRYNVDNMSVDERELYRIVGHQIRLRREKLKLSQNKIADDVGVQRTSITNIESGRQKPPLHLLYSICIALKIELADVLPKTGDVELRKVVAVEVNKETKQMPPKAAHLLEQMLKG